MLALIGNSTLLFAQDQYPREFTNPDEIVAFDRNTSYNEAIEVLNQFYQDYENKFIIDQTRTSGEIGVSFTSNALGRCIIIYLEAEKFDSN